jgi:DNA-binding NarL/FixJ family response regulator
MNQSITNLNIVICDDHQVVLEGLNQILSNEIGLKATGLFNSGTDLIHFLSNKSNLVDVVIVDVQLKNETGFEIAKEIRKLGSYKIIMFSSFVDAYLILKAKQIGVNACISKDINSKRLIQIIKNESLVFCSFPEFESNNDTMKCEELVSAIGLLTKRELELMRELVSGNVSKDLANKLNISVYTLETHKKNIFRKLEINSIGELINIAHKYRIVA